MAEANLNIRIGADTSQVDKAIDKLTSELGKFNAAIDRGDKDAFKNLSASLNRIQKDIKGINPQLDGLLGRLRDQTLKLSVETDTKSIEKLKADISQTQRLISGLKGVPPQVAQSFDKVKASSNGASQGILSFSRVISDAPFGIIGIANNLEQLPLAFQQIKKTAQESGKTIGATLVGALTGPAGLALALSAVSAAFTFASVGFDAWTKGFGKSKDEVDQYKKRIDELKESLRGIDQIRIDAAADSDAQIVSINALSKAVSDSNTPYYQRKKALEELKKINKDYFGDLTLETATVTELTRRTEEYSKSLIAQAVLKGAQEDISKISTLRRNELAIIQKLTPEYQELSKQLDEVQKQRASAVRTSGSITGVVSDPLATQEANIRKRLENITKELKRSGSSVDTLNQQFRDLENVINTETENIIKLKVQPDPGSIEELRKKLKETQELLAKATDAEQAKKYRNEIIKIKQELKNLNPSVASNNTSLEQLNELRNRYAQLRLEIPAPFLNLPEKDQIEALKNYLEANITLGDIIAKQKQDAKEEAFKLGEDAFTEFQKGIEKEASKTTINPFLAKIGVKPEYNVVGDATIDQKVAAKLQDRLNAALKTITNITGQVPVTPVLTGDNDQLESVTRKYENEANNLKLLEQQAKNTATVISDLLTPAFNSFFQALVTGSGSPFKAFGQALKQLLVQIAAAITKAIIFKAIMTALFPQSAAAGLSLGSLISQSLGFAGNVGGTAAGSISTAGARGLAAPGSQQLVTEVRGSSLAFILQRTSQTTNRLG